MQQNSIEPKPNRRRVWLRKFILILLGFLIGGVLVEIGLRLIGYSYPEFYASDARRGYSLRPGMEGWYRKEGAAYVRINSDGLRDREHPQPKPANTLRVAVLGDSFIEALQVPFEDSFCAVLDRELKSCPALAGRNVEVINFGVSGYGTAQELLTLRSNVWQYAPDIVLLTVTTNNDISDNSRALKKTDQIPYFILQDERLVEDDSFLNTRSFRSRNAVLGRIGRWFREHLRTVQAVQQAAFATRVALAERKARSKAAEKAQQPVNNVQAPEDELGIDNLVYREPSDRVWLNAWNVTEQLIKIIHDDVSKKGASFMVLTLSNPPQVLPAPAAREAFLRRVSAKDIFYPDNRIREFCRRENIPVTNLAPPMQKYAEEHNVMLHGFGQDIGNGHWNVTGHRVAGEFAATEVCRLLQNGNR